MRGYTVSEVARLSGVSVRALHHYDALGLLKPACVGANGYRYYGRDELLRLQQILFHRELGLPLDEIGRILDAPDFDRKATLKAHRARLEAQRRRYGRLIRTIDETLAALEGATAMDNEDLYKGFAPEKQAEYEAWLEERYGGDMANCIAASKTHVKAWSKADWRRQAEEGEGIELAFADALRHGAPADSAAVQALAGRWADWVGRAWGRRPTREAFVGLAQLYQAHPDFRSRYESRADGLTEYLAEAMRLFAERELH